MDTLDDFVMTRPATADRPLLGLTVLVVEDSRYACEALRLLCLRSGARIRRADSLFSARRHMKVYRPGVVIIDLGLPDGPGTELITELARAQPRVDVILGISGDPDAEGLARAAGADGFLTKPIARLAEFQAAILAHLPPGRQPPGPRVLPPDEVRPDPLAYRDDLAHAAAVLDQAGDPRQLGYATQFLGSIARTAADAPLEQAVEALETARLSGGATGADLSRLSGLLQARLLQAGGI